MRRTLAAGAVAVSAALAACGSGGSGGNSRSATQSGSPASTSSSSPSPVPAYGSAGGGSSASSTSGAGASIRTRHTSLGTFIVDAPGRSLYLFVKDKGPKSTCYGACASVWPPLTAKGAPTAVSGLNASLLGTTKRTDGTTQLTYGGHPLYLYQGDQSPGDTKGQGLTQFGAKWYLVRPSGRKLDND